MKNAPAILEPTLPQPGIIAMDGDEFKRLRKLIHKQTGIWLRDGKEVMLASRLSRRLRAHGMDHFTDYCEYVETVQDGGRELGELINCVTTNKTSFFRESHHFDFLARTVVPEAQAAAARGAAKHIRIWSAASSTGEEPYSIAICLMEALIRSAGVASPNLAALSGGSPDGPKLSAYGLLPGNWEIEVQASDIDTAVLEKARRGVYPAEAADDLPPNLLESYFLRGKGEMAGQVKVKKDVATRVEFKRINLMDPVWPLEGRFHAIFFRNALIYFDRETQERFLRKMLPLLMPRGYLILGHSEHVPWLHDAVVPLSRNIHRLRDPAHRGRKEQKPGGDGDR